MKRFFTLGIFLISLLTGLTYSSYKVHAEEIYESNTASVSYYYNLHSAAPSAPLRITVTNDKPRTGSTGFKRIGNKYYYYFNGHRVYKNFTLYHPVAGIEKYTFDVSSVDGEILRRVVYYNNGSKQHIWFNPEKLAMEKATSIMYTLIDEYRKENGGRYPDRNGRLKLAFNYACSYSGNPSMRSNGLMTGFHYAYNEPSRARSTWRAEYAVLMLEEGNGRCYSFAAAFGYLARAAGFRNAEIYVGMTSRRGGGRTPHAWVGIEIDGRNYIFDPQQANKSQNNNLFYYMPNGAGGIGYFDGNAH